MKRNILNKHQQEFIINFLHSDLREDFYLSWWTSLAEFYLQHRLSDDLDFFCIQDTISTTQVQSFLGNLQINNTKIQQISKQKLYDRNLYNIKYKDQELKTEFSLYPKPLYPLQKYNLLSIESIEDIFVDKLMCLYDRNDPKDFVDLYFLLQDSRLTIAQWLIDVTKKFWVSISGTSFALACNKVSLIKQLPIMIKHLNIKDLQDFFNTLSYQYGKVIFE